MIQIKQLKFSINKKIILSDINLEITQGCYFSLSGVNGAGKSTLIKLVLDLLRSDEKQQILLKGASSWESKCREILTYLPERFHINKSVSGLEYCRFIAGVNQQKMDVKAIELLSERLDFKVENLKKNVNSYSKGMMQKLGLISNFMLNKPLMILDEPLSGLDPKARYCLKELLKEKKKEGLTLFYSTHMLADAEEICDQFGILHDGSLKFVGTPQQCMDDYAADTLEAAYMSCIT